MGSQGAGSPIQHWDLRVGLQLQLGSPCSGGALPQGKGLVAPWHLRVGTDSDACRSWGGGGRERDRAEALLQLPASRRQQPRSPIRKRGGGSLGKDGRLLCGGGGNLYLITIERCRYQPTEVESPPCSHHVQLQAMVGLPHPLRGTDCRGRGPTPAQVCLLQGEGPTPSGLYFC